MKVKKMKTTKFWNLKKTERGSYQLDLFGYVGGDQEWGEGFNEKDFVKDFRQIPADAELELSINSQGGSVFTALSIVSILGTHKAPITIRVNGLAASAATIITSTPGAKVVMPVGSMMMIHRVSSVAMGSADEIHRQADATQKIEDQIVDLYMRKTGKAEREIRDAMSEDNWMSAEEAKAFGLADEVDDKAAVSNVFDGDSVEVNGLRVPKTLFGASADRLFVAAAQPAPAAVKKEGPKMDLEKLKAEYPDLVSAIREEAMEEGRKCERARLEAIEAVAMPGYEALVKAAKADPKKTAENLAIEIVRAEMGRRTSAARNMAKDAKDLDAIEPDANSGIVDDVKAVDKEAEAAAIKAARAVIANK